MFQRTRHFAPTFRAWDASDARRAIMEIATDAMSRVDATTLWPTQGCSTLSIEFPVEERIGSGESGSISILTEC
jgi:hypothetical protein